MNNSVLDIFGQKKDLLPAQNCKGFYNTAIKYLFYAIYFYLTIMQISSLKEPYIAQYTFLNDTLKYLSITYFISMMVSLMHTLNLFVLAGVLTNFNGMHCAKEVIVETAFFFKDKSLKYQTRLAIIFTLAILPIILMYSLLPYFIIYN